ncbi:DsbA family protein [Nannocystis bainbridge]|uniref:Thioredoxin domain-containing protein n=1 Tax=Nannocystis bainbridge TaxID=2995303 RepID=A0ABT5DUW3_9BACT|nr:thioredoxin domain-containing protein [Nannocystis bainbridge]MDC0717351.1 thioredoxin domain-containing protein [Nannocystis bainbridge]
MPRPSLRTALLGASLALLSCSRPKASAEAPAEAQATGESPLAQAAAGLPGFETGGIARDVPHERFYVEVGDAPVRGPADAPVTIVAFSDFECPYCEKGHRSMLALEQEFAGQLRFAYKAFPLEFHGYALVAALMARSALEQGKFWGFYDRIFGQKGMDLESLQDAARAAELDLSKIQDDLEALRWGTAVQKDLRQGRRLGVTGTPAYFINGRHINGAKPLELLRSVVREELELAAKWREQGVKPDRIYAHAIQDGYREVQVRKPRPGLKPDVIYPVPIDDSPQRGPATALVTIVEFADFECGFCVRGHETVEKLRRRYGDKVRVVFKHYPLPFHSHAFMAARAAMAAQAEGKFWEFHDRLYGEKARFDEDTLLQIARELKLDPKKFKQRLHGAEADARIVTDQDLGTTLGVRGTPAYFVNGRAVDGAVPELEFRLVIQEELERAEALLREGVPPAALYHRLVTPPAPSAAR